MKYEILSLGNNAIILYNNYDFHLKLRIKIIMIINKNQMRSSSVMKFK